eukprot:TRINITY_DN25452_c0_g1_i1.p1 TRINITY_DN25452_c0_g1~~TRINITY_DN25452_c0_g1_i1.p1  ORF type:complete len:431 (+),score=31.88 TRINITY_DN25452_c0_g1_i1:59-1351(+)
MMTTASVSLAGCESMACSEADQTPVRKTFLGGGRWQSFLNLIKVMLGSGMLALPQVITEMGFIYGSAAFVGCVCAAYYTLSLVPKSYQMYAATLQGEQPLPQTIAELTEALLGWHWRYAVEFVTVLLQCAFCTAYVLVILRAAEEIMGLPRTVAALLMLPVFIPLGMVTKLRKLWIVSAMGLLVFLFCVMIGSLEVARNSGLQLEWRPGSTEKRGHFMEWIGWLGSILYSIEIVNAVVPNATSLDRPQDFPPVLAVTFIVYCTLVGGWVLLASSYGLGSCDMALDCLPGQSSQNIIEGAVALNLLVTLPLPLFPAAQLLERLCSSPLEEGQGVLHQRWQLMVRPALTILVVAIGASVTSLGALTGFVGSTLMMALGFVLPLRLHAAAKALPGHPHTRQSGLAVRIFRAVLCCAAMAVALLKTAGVLGMIH